MLLAIGAVALVAMLADMLAPRAARAVVAALVQVTNTEKNPVPVHDVDDGTGFPFQAGTFLRGSGGFLQCSPISVPSSTPDNAPVKRLVIEYVSGEFLSGSESPILVALQFQQGQTFATVDLLPVKTGSNSTVVSTPTRLYLDPGSQLTCLAESSGSGASYTDAQLFFSGHLELVHQ